MRLISRWETKLPDATTLFDKIWDAHVITDLGGGAALIAIDRIFLHERTGAAAMKSMAEAGRPVVDVGDLRDVAHAIANGEPDWRLFHEHCDDAAVVGPANQASSGLGQQNLGPR